ncbi:hypothetical protein L210DRAFT_936105, partial [Boletus edulis BED1]
YLLDGNRYAFSLNADITSSLTTGSKAKLRKLQEETYLRYARPMQRTLALLLWISHILMTRKSDAPTLLGSLKTVLLELRKEQKVLLSSLYGLLMSPKQPKLADFLPILHSLFITIICHEVSAEGKFGCPTDYSLCVGSLLPNGCFQQANVLTRDCAALQHTFIVTLFQEARLQYHNIAEFSPYDRSHWVGIDLDRPLCTLWDAEKELVEVEEEELDDVEDQINADVQESESASEHPASESAEEVTSSTEMKPISLLDLIDIDEDAPEHRESTQFLKYATAHKC